jgi:prepilin-type processing-associated H-X9-DG protein
MSDISDGTSSTALMSESVLGLGGDRLYHAPTPAQVPRVYAYFLSSIDMTPELCAGANGWFTNGNSKWADGEPYCTMYDHHYPPNPPQYDCVSLSANWKAARSRHPGGVNLLLADGSVRFVTNGVDLATWHALGSRAGGEVISEF